MKLSNHTDIEDFVIGASFLGAGGGGRPHEGLRALKMAIEEKGAIEWTDADNIPDDSLCLCPFMMGSAGPITEQKKRALKKMGLEEEKYPVNLIPAIREWEEYSGKKADVIVPLEAGGGNMPVPLAAAAMLGKIAVDGDYAGRAVPEINQSTLMLEDVPFCPGASVDKYGNTAILKKSVNILMAERMGKFLSRVALGSTGLAGFPLEANRMKRILVRGTMTQSLEIGRLLRKAETGEITLRQAMKRCGAVFLFSGTVSRKDDGEEGGYYIGEYIIENERDKSEARLFFKNEIHIVWINAEYAASSPDIIGCIHPEQRRPVRNDEIEVEMPLEVYVMPAPPIWRNEKIFRNLNPRYFGFDLDYRGIGSEIERKMK